MNKYDFLLKVDSIVKELKLDLSLFIEQSIKISPTNFNTDRVNFKIPSQELNYDLLIRIISKLEFNKKVYDFIDFVYKKYEKDIKYIFFGFSEGNYEIYFEKWIKDDIYYPNMSDIISYDLKEDVIYEYYPFDTSIEVDKLYLVNNLIDYCKKYDIDLSNQFTTFGYVKDTGYCHIGYFQSNNDFLNKLKNLSKYIKSDYSIIEWFEKNQNIYITLVGYVIVNDKLTLSIYFK